MKKVLSIAIVAFIICAGIYAIFHNIYNFTPERWSDDKEHRYLMIKDLEKKHNIVGMSDKEIIDLLGEPELTTVSPSQSETKILGYYIASGRIDPMFYEIYFDNGLAINMQRIEH